jgi:hypothetical protein
MSASQYSQRTASFVGILGAFLVVALLVYVMKQSTRPAPLNQARAQERSAASKELREASVKALGSHDWQDQGKGVVRLKIERAMELTVQEYKNPAAARTNLIARAEVASAPPPKPPEQPNQFE